MKKKIITVIFCSITCSLVLFMTACGENKSVEQTSFDKTNTANTQLIDKIPVPEIPSSIKIEFKTDITDNPSAEEQTKFDFAHDLWYKGDTEEALKEFEGFLETYSESDLADDAQYYIGVCFDNLEDYENSLESYSKVIINYPNSSSVASAYYSIAWVYGYALDDPEKAIPYYVACIDKASLSQIDTVNKAITNLEETTSIQFEYPNSYDAPTQLPNDLSGLQPNTNESVDKILEIARLNSKTALDYDLEIAYNYIKNNYPNYYTDNLKMELTMYYGTLLDCSFPETFDLSKLGFKALECVKYVYRGYDAIDSPDTQVHLQRLEKLILSSKGYF
ncbi:tetratricopeptide repeat protein [Ruminococcus sp. OA3]|uniref:tetratricopeptide repeat protein n=1 Tax=Ruminococcus sp. OA3 TaxID=2914164 RepID=UPI001F06C7F5|nr:tetratricopeptide repeat protein [Ruminococcus sp. OA3]MCH1980968.1 tetratricopeptide repeat protein [Ruminococcus sp. OA3]MCH1984585.1 tetratricopeptide repeat protein [Ruminococcus sp. OA3]MCH1984600.1 tetratricopeptide repeat protein [Ruminococcus sp. OA3]